SRRHSRTTRGHQLCVRWEGQEDAVCPRARRAGRRRQRSRQRGASLVDSDDRAGLQGTGEVTVTPISAVMLGRALMLAAAVGTATTQVAPLRASPLFP